MKVRFPWNTIIALGVAFELLVFSVALFGDFKFGMDSALGGAIAVALAAAGMLAIVVLFVHAFFKLIEAVFRLNRPKFGRQPDSTRDKPFG